MATPRGRHIHGALQRLHVGVPRLGPPEQLRFPTAVTGLKIYKHSGVPVPSHTRCDRRMRGPQGGTLGAGGRRSPHKRCRSGVAMGPPRQRGTRGEKMQTLYILNINGLRAAQPTRCGTIRRRHHAPHFKKGSLLRVTIASRGRGQQEQQVVETGICLCRRDKGMDSTFVLGPKGAQGGKAGPRQT